ncbi:MAG: hypothetical protein ABI557_20290, partial [Aureliella sp.]
MNALDNYREEMKWWYVIPFNEYDSCSTGDLVLDPINASNKKWWCTVTFREKALLDCREGSEELSVTIGSEYNYNVPGGGGGNSISYTITRGAREGTTDMCARMSRERQGRCEEQKDVCLKSLTAQIVQPNRDRTSAVEQEAILVTETEQLLLKIDRNALGFVNGKSTYFRSLERAASEDWVSYRDRLRFLAAWSAFVKKPKGKTGVFGAFPKEKRNMMHARFKEYQNRYLEETRKLNQAISITLIPPPNIAENPQARAELEAKLINYAEGHYRFYGITINEFRPKDFAREIGSARANWFLRDVWPGIQNFGRI